MFKFSLFIKTFLFISIFSINPFTINAQDADSDGILDDIDIDDDNDGIIDPEEGCVLDTLSFAITNGDSSSNSIYSGVYGFTLDITRIDNSFNLDINGIQLTSTEMEFHAPIRTVEFADGSYYGGGGVSNIWSLGWSTPADDATPLLRVKVAADGSVSLFGSKTLNGPLEPMVFVTDSVTVNAVTWNAGNNTVTVDQIINGSTFINGNVYGYIYECNKDTDGDGITDNFDLDSDNDGIPDLIEAGGSDTQGDGVVDDLTDADMDGLVDDLDNFDSGSGGSEVTSGTPLNMSDVDGDGVPGYQDLDSDNDGINDVVEAGITDTDNNGIVDGVNLDGSLSSDADTDGFTDALDTNDNAIVGTGDGSGTAVITTDPDADSNGTPDDDDADGTAYNGGDVDSDGIPDFMDLDSDDDGIFDILESGNGSADTFADGTFDSDDVGYADSDGDGIPDQLDNDVTGFGDAGDSGTSDDSSDPTDPNSGGTGIVVDSGTDADGDGIADSVDEVVVHFGSPVDSDGDGIYDNVDTDDDNDGIPDDEETICNSSGESIQFKSTNGSIHAPINDAVAPVGSSSTLLDVSISSGGFEANKWGTIKMSGSLNVVNTATLTFEEEVTLIIGSHTSSIGGNFDLNERWRLYSVGETFEVDDPDDDLTDPRTTSIIVDGAMSDTVEFYRNAGGQGNGLDWTITSSPAKVFYLEFIALESTNIGQVKASVKCLYKDADGDGILDRLESNIIDTDGDGNADYDDDNADGEAGTDGIGGEEDGVEYGHWNDADNDGIPDHLDADNGDGSGGDITGSGDSDADGLSDTEECPSGYICPDADGDNIPDYMDDFTCPASLVLASIDSVSIATESCEKINGWTYYYDINDPSVAIFAIEHTPTGGNTNPFTADVTITVTADPTTSGGVNSNEDSPNLEGNFAMGRDWNVDIITGSLNGPVNIRFYYDPAELTATIAAATTYATANTPTLNISDPIWFKTVGATYDPSSNTATSINNGNVIEFGNLSPDTEDGITYVEMTGITSFSGGTAAIRVSEELELALPVELTAFNVYEKDCAVHLDWSTKSEKDFDFFVIERSRDGNEFERVIEILSSGNENGDTYGFVDREASFINYYRLKMVDLDGYTEYSDVINLEVNCEDLEGEINVFPNPINPRQTLNIKFTSNLETETLVMFDFLGREVKRLTIGTQEGKNLLGLDISDLPTGSYYAQFLGRRKFKKIVIQE